MKTAVLCPGPSINQTFKGRDEYQLVAGVNRAVHRAPCDLWVSLDPHPIEQLPMTLFTTEATARDLLGRGRWLAGGSIIEAERQTDIPADLGGASWRSFSTPAALMAMFLKGAKLIDLYGHDMTNAPDFDGVMLKSNDRRPDRWSHENLCMELVVKWLASKGCVVNRIMP